MGCSYFLDGTERYLRLSLEMCPTSQRWMIDCLLEMWIRPSVFALRPRERLTRITKRDIARTWIVWRQSWLDSASIIHAHEVSSAVLRHACVAFMIRFGLGKTIEAAWILHRLLVNRPNINGYWFLLFPNRFWCIKWFVESCEPIQLMVQYFWWKALRFSWKRGARKEIHFLRMIKLVICSIEFFGRFLKKRAKTSPFLLTWDIVGGWIEAHQPRWSVAEAKPRI